MGFEQSEYTRRITKLQKVLGEKDVDLAILSQNSDLYYYTGSVQPVYLIVPAAGEPVALARKAIDRIREEAPGVKLEGFNNTKDLARIISSYGVDKAGRIGFTIDTIAYGSVLRWLQLYPGASVVDLSWEVRMARVVKSEAEIAIQTRAGKIMAGIPRVITEGFKPGMTELELSVLVESYLRLHGHGGFLRCRREGIETSMGVCSAGVNALAGTKFDGICSGVGVSNAFPYGGTHQPIPKGAPVLVDFGYPLEGYHVDQTWMFGWGKQSAEVIRAFQAMVQVEQLIIDQVKPGNLWSEIYENAVKLAADLGFEAEFMGFGPEKVRFVGHGVGLELDEPPYLAPKMDYELAPGMVLAVEPKVMIPGVGVIGPENTLVVRDSGNQLLTERCVDFLLVE